MARILLRRLTVHALAKLDNLSQRHGFPVLGGKVRQDTRSESDLLIQITFGEAISTEFEFRRGSIAQVGVEDTQGIKVGDMMTSDLVGPNEKLYLQR